MKHEGWQEAALGVGLDLEQDQIALLDTYAQLLREHAVPYGFDRRVGRRAPRGAASRGLAPLRGPRSRSRCDRVRPGFGGRAPRDPRCHRLPSGSGWGWSNRGEPGLPSSNSRSSGWTSSASACSIRGSNGWSNPCRCASPRAFATATASWTAAGRLLVPGGRLIYFAGERFDESSLPADTRTEVVRSSALARSGPLVIMTRT